MNVELGLVAMRIKTQILNFTHVQKIPKVIVYIMARSPSPTNTWIAGSYPGRHWLCFATYFFYVTNHHLGDSIIDKYQIPLYPAWNDECIFFFHCQNRLVWRIEEFYKALFYHEIFINRYWMAKL